MTRLNRRSHLGCAHRSPRANARRRGFTFVELLVVLFLMIFIGTFAASCVRRTRHDSTIPRCSSNLRQIGQAILLYANDNRGVCPRTRMSAGPVRLPVFGTGVPATQPFTEDGPAENDVTASLFLLLRTQDITSEVFTCPSGNAVKDEFGGHEVTARSNFTDYKTNLSYSFQNLYANNSAIAAGWKWANDMGPEYAVAADLNPGTAGDGDNVFGPTPTSSAREMRQANSRNHNQDGQNILYGDGHVAWESNPFVGVNRDHIYTTADKKILASPVDANDSILLPTDD